jgi:deoxycytidylate deaminase
MEYLFGKEHTKAIIYFLRAKEIALESTCRRSLCGSVIAQNNEIIGKGFNGPPGLKESQRRCFCLKENFDKKITDKTCCIHAEQRAIIDALKYNPDKIVGSSLYFIRLDMKKEISYAGRPYCTICSKMALDVGIKNFVLWHEKGICVYNTEEYNSLSFDYRE